jgi:hypothetical protein
VTTPTKARVLPDNIANRPWLYKSYVRQLAGALGANVDFFTFDYIANTRGTTEKNNAIMETETRIREGKKAFEVPGNMSRVLGRYFSTSNAHFGRRLVPHFNITTVRVYKPDLEQSGLFVLDHIEYTTTITYD